MDIHRRSLPAFVTRHPWVVPVLVALVFHGASLFGTFVYDDVPLIPEHPHLTSEGFAQRIWTRDYGMEFADMQRGSYRPLFMTVVFMLHTVFGSSPFAFHLFSLICFCTAAALVTRAALHVSSESVPVAVVAGILYAVHPARVETASLFMSLPDLLIEISALGIILQLLRLHKEDRPRKPWTVYAACFGIAAAASVTKESAFFVLPALAITSAVHTALHHKDRIGTKFIPAAAIILGLALGMLCRQLASVQSPTSISVAALRLVQERAVPTLRLLGCALREIIVPGPAVFWRQLPGQEASPAAAAAVVTIVVLAGILWILSLRCTRPIVPLLTAWLAAGAINLMLLSAAGYTYSQRYLVIAPAVILLCIAGRCHLAPVILNLLRSAREQLGFRVAWLLLTAYLATHGAYTLAGTFTCWTPLSFFTAMHEANPYDVMPLGAVAESLNAVLAPPELVEKRVRQATDLNIHHPQVPLLHNMVIKRYIRDQSFHGALRFADWSLTLFPSDHGKLALRAVALASIGQFDEALASADEAISLAPEREAYRTLRNEITANRSQSTPAIR